jgi:hypothetical protein
MSEHKSDISRRAMLVRMGQVAASSVLLPNVLHAAAVLPDEAGDVAIMYPVPERLSETNRESWKQIARFYEEALKEHHFKDWYLESALRLVRDVEQSSLAGSFRAGQAVYMLMVSTKECHGLEAGDPYVIVEPEAPGKIGMAYRDPSDRLAASEVVPEPEARACLERMLMRLWADSPGRGQLP